MPQPDKPPMNQHDRIDGAVNTYIKHLAADLEMYIEDDMHDEGYSDTETAEVIKIIRQKLTSLL